MVTMSESVCGTTSTRIAQMPFFFLICVSAQCTPGAEENKCSFIFFCSDMKQMQSA